MSYDHLCSFVVFRNFQEIAHQLFVAQGINTKKVPRFYSRDFLKIRKYIKFLHNMSSYSALPLGVKWGIAMVAKELPPHDSPFACRGRDRRFRFSYLRKFPNSDAIACISLGLKVSLFLTISYR
jgi:hypothetical protein